MVKLNQLNYVKFLLIILVIVQLGQMGYALDPGNEATSNTIETDASPINYPTHNRDRFLM